MGKCEINGYVVSHWYAGIDNYSVRRVGDEGGEPLAVCWDYDTIARIVGVDVETLKAEMWRQR